MAKWNPSHLPGLTDWFDPADAKRDKDGNVVKWPNRARRWRVRLRQWWIRVRRRDG